MSEHITTCVNCHDDLEDSQDAYCSQECKNENESPNTEYSKGHYNTLRCEEITGISPGEQ